MANVNKVLGAVGLTGTSGSLTKISSSLLRDGDIGFAVTSSAVYFFKCYEDAAPQTTGDFTVDNPPLILKPEDDEDTNIRWKLISINSLTSSVKQNIGEYIQTSKIRGYSTLDFESEDGTAVAGIGADNSFWVKDLEIDDSSLVKNLNAEFIDGVEGNQIIVRDGSRSFTSPVSGPEPTEASHYVTKNFVDAKLTLVDPDQYIRKDGSSAFLAPVSGVNPVHDYHLTTKEYVETRIENTLEQIDESQNNIVYKNGSLTVPVNSKTMNISFGGVLENYSVSLSLVNIDDEDPSFYMYNIVEKESTSFTIEFSGDIDSPNFKLDWSVIAIQN